MSTAFDIAIIGAGVAGCAWTLNIKNVTPIQARIVLNCAGNFGDLVEAIARPSPFTITPRKGQFVVSDKPAHGLVQSIILPVPTARTKGIVITRTAFGNLLVGPTAEDQTERRLATQFKDYQIEALPARNWITAGGIRRVLELAAPHIPGLADA